MNGNDAIKMHTIRGFSMYPQYKNGDIITGKAFDGILIRGHCYGFYHNGIKVFHRYLGKKGNICIFTGDNCSLFEAVSENAIFFCGDDPGLLLYNYSVTCSNLFFYFIYRINPFKTLKTVCARGLYYIVKRELPPWMKKNHT